MTLSAQLFSNSPLQLDNGAELRGVEAAYSLTGEISEARDNVVLICHALSGDQYVASPHPITGKPGWWDRMVGPGKIIDTHQYAVLCINVLGGSMGSTAPKSINPKTKRPYALDFPIITIADMVRVQQALLDHLGIKRLALAIGGSMGGMQVLQWLATQPERIGHAAILAASARHTAQNIALHEIGRQAIMADQRWNGGDYYHSDSQPDGGLAVARMIAHISYLSAPALDRKFDRRLQDRTALSFSFDADFQVESYLRHQGDSFTRRFDANSYLYITRALDYFDLAAAYHGNLAAAFSNVADVPCDVVSFSSDWLYTPAENKNIAEALQAAGAKASFTNIEADAGHDSFLLAIDAFDAWMERLMKAVAEQ